MEVDYHFSDCGSREVPYGEGRAEVQRIALEALRKAYEIGLKYVIFIHGRFTSRPGLTTARSEVRKMFRSQDATPFGIRRDCIPHII